MADNETEIIPYDILIDILSRLPGKSLLRFRGACKHWRDIIDHDPHFLALCRAHRPPFTLASLSRTRTRGVVRLYAFNDKKNAFTKTDDFECDAIRSTHTVLPSCGGLICCYGERHVLVLNPSTSDRRLLLLPPTPTSTIIGCGFGYSPSLKTHKVVRFIDHPCGSKCEVFTLGADSWRPVEQQPLERLINFNHRCRRPVSVHGKIYWIGFERHTRRPVLVGFDLETERFAAVDEPRLGVNVDHLYLRVVEARLGVVKKIWGQWELEKMEIWVMEREGVWRERYAFGLEVMPEAVWGMKAVVRQGKGFYLCESSEKVLKAGDDDVVGFDVVKLVEFEDGGDSDGLLGTKKQSPLMLLNVTD
ncbi:F-box protein [Acorus calamus]|uniref:F-box protein n=1 Tax=Acorus calamus TaxID=4465 RepID=A0AAV9EBN2_ACOCL|nr:F-box protein [Acorus calamus]